jgi:hypothetical protein
MFNKNNKNAVLDEHLTDILDETTLVDRYIWLRAAVFLVISALIGVISISFRPYFKGGAHLEAIVALVILIGMNIGLLRYFIQHKRKWYKFAYGLSVCAIYGGHIGGWFIGGIYIWDAVWESIWEELWMMNVLFAFFWIVIGYLSFFLNGQWIKEKALHIKPGYKAKNN